MSSSSCVASRVNSVQLEGQRHHLGLLWGGGNLCALESWFMARAVAHKDSTLILDMTVLTTAAKDIEMVHLGRLTVYILHTKGLW